MNYLKWRSFGLSVLNPSYHSLPLRTARGNYVVAFTWDAWRAQLWKLVHKPPVLTIVVIQAISFALCGFISMIFWIATFPRGEALALVAGGWLGSILIWIMVKPRLAQSWAAESLAKGYCPRCAYDLNGRSGGACVCIRCSECGCWWQIGTAVESESIPSAL